MLCVHKIKLIVRCKCVRLGKLLCPMIDLYVQLHTHVLNGDGSRQKYLQLLKNGEVMVGLLEKGIYQTRQGNGAIHRAIFSLFTPDRSGGFPEC